ncbi:MAG: CPBP family intramembrane metalloprotease [Deltaproteobacteria bacterium]|nr:CPBP family intramembrane metalloprotease [Deltaproteobacteria bacterium]
MSRTSPIPVRPVLLLGGVLLLVRLAGWAAPAVRSPLLSPEIAAAALFLYTPLFRYARRWPPAWIRIPDPRRSALLTAGLAAGGALVFLIYRRLPLPPALLPYAGPLPPFGEFLLGQLLLAALPEEVFFRGYLYDAFEEAGIAPAVATAVLFAAAHLVIRPTPYRALTLFPGLVFGWARKRTGTLWAPAALHLAFNLFPWLPEF